MTTELAVRFDYGSVVPWVLRLPDGRNRRKPVAVVAKRATELPDACGTRRYDGAGRRRQDLLGRPTAADGWSPSRQNLTIPVQTRSKGNPLMHAPYCTFEQIVG